MFEVRQDSSTIPLIGVLLAGDSTYPSFTAFREGLGELGHTEGQTFKMEARFAAGQLDQLPHLAAELVALRIDVIAVVGAVAFWAARQATSDTPPSSRLCSIPLRPAWLWMRIAPAGIPQE
jgi:putative ABC transport system substrate-binding protein